jgi:protease I
MSWQADLTEQSPTAPASGTYVLRLSLRAVERAVTGAIRAASVGRPCSACTSGDPMRMTDVASGPGALDLRAVVLTADKFEDMELFVPYFRLLDAGAHVDIAAPSRDDIGGEHGYTVSPDLLIDDVDPDAYDLLIVPGGFPDGAPAVVRGIAKAQQIARSFFAADKPVASICHGPWLLVSADLVRGRHLTSYWHDGVPEEIRAAGGLWQDEPVVVDGNLVTSRWPADLAAFTAAMMTLVGARPTA